MGNSNAPKIALGCEYPLAMRGGVSVLVAKLIEGLAPHFQIVLVSPDRAENIMRQPVHAHVHWNPAAVSRATSRVLADRLSELGVELAHLHSGGNYGWGSRIPGHSPIPYLSKNGVACVSTIHLALSVLDGYCDAKKPVWFKLAVLPVAWLGKMHTLQNLCAEITVSRDSFDKVRRWYWPLRSRFRHIYHSRLESVTGGESVRDQTILCVGHIAFRKGQLVLARAFAKIAAQFPDWKLLIVGGVAEAVCVAELKEIAARLPNQISLLDDRDDAFDLMQKAAIFVQPSFFEGLPLALQEAMASGCACVASRISGNMELIDNERTGLLVPAGDVDAFASALQRLMVDAASQEKFRRAAPAAIIEKEMTAQKMIEQHLALYESILRHC